MARLHEPPESYYSLDPWAVGAPAVSQPGAKPGPGGGWMESAPWRPARRASPRAVRPAPPAAAPAGAECNQWVQEARTTPRALGAAAKFHWLRAPGGCGLGPGGRGHYGAQQTKTVLLGPARAAQGRGSAVGTLHTGPPEPPTCLVRGAVLTLLRPWGASPCLDAILLLKLIVLASVIRTLWRALPWN